MSKQLYFNRLNFPYEILDIMKSFAFYDKKIGELLIFMKLKKQEISNAIENAQISRKNRDAFDFDDEEHWAFCVDYRNEKQFQASNCALCGGYKLIGDSVVLAVIPDVIRCNCNIHIV